MQRCKIVFALIVVVFLFTGCDKIMPTGIEEIGGGTETTAEPSVDGALLARVGSWAISLEDFNERLAGLKSMYPEAGSIDRPETKKQILQELVNMQILAQVAESRNLGEEKDVKAEVQNFKRQLLAQKLREEIAKNVLVTEIEVENFYETNQRMFREPEERRIREIIVSSKSQAKNAAIRLLQGESFSVLAREISIADSASKGGDLGYLTPNPEEKFEKFWEVAFTTEKGENSSYFKGPEGDYHIVKIEDIRGGKVRSLSEVRGNIREYLKTQKIAERLEEAISSAKRNVKITINQNLLE